MEALDGNAIAGLLQDVFGHDMTTATGVCAHCGNEGLLAECRVYVRAPGVVVRCRTCGAVLAVFVERNETALRRPPGSPGAARSAQLTAPCPPQRLRFLTLVVRPVTVGALPGALSAFWHHRYAT